jgi:phage-related protein
MDEPSAADVQAYADMLNNTVTGLKSTLSTMTNLLATLRPHKSANWQRNLILFNEATQRIKTQRETLETVVGTIFKARKHLAAVAKAIGNVVARLGKILDDFMKLAWEKIKHFVANIKAMFWTFVQNIGDALGSFVSWVTRCMSGLFPAPLVGV